MIASTEFWQNSTKFWNEDNLKNETTQKIKKPFKSEDHTNQEDYLKK